MPNHFLPTPRKLFKFHLCSNICFVNAARDRARLISRERLEFSEQSSREYTYTPQRNSAVDSPVYCDATPLCTAATGIAIARKARYSSVDVILSGLDIHRETLQPSGTSPITMNLNEATQPCLKCVTIATKTFRRARDREIEINRFDSSVCTENLPRAKGNKFEHNNVS